MHYLQLTKFALIGSVLALVMASTAAAELINVEIRLSVTGIDPGVQGFAIGDSYTLNFTVDDATVDTGSGSTGLFLELVTMAEASAVPGNVGTWTPSGTFDPTISNFVTNSNGDGITLQLRGSGFPNAGGSTVFKDVDLAIDWSVVGDLTDSGLGDTFAEQLAPFQFGVPPGEVRSDTSIRFDLDDDFLTVQLTATSIFNDDFETGTADRWSSMARRWWR